MLQDKKKEAINSVSNENHEEMEQKAPTVILVSNERDTVASTNQLKTPRSRRVFEIGIGLALPAAVGFIVYSIANVLKTDNIGTFSVLLSSSSLLCEDTFARWYNITPALHNCIPLAV